MMLSVAKKRLLDGEQLDIEVMRNPSNLSEWVAWIHESSGKSFLLVDDNERSIKFADAAQMFQLLKSIGFRRATVIF